MFDREWISGVGLLGLGKARIPALFTMEGNHGSIKLFDAQGQRKSPGSRAERGVLAWTTMPCPREKKKTPSGDV